MTAVVAQPWLAEGQLPSPRAQDQAGALAAQAAGPGHWQALDAQQQALAAQLQAGGMTGGPMALATPPPALSVSQRHILPPQDVRQPPATG